MKVSRLALVVVALAAVACAKSPAPEAPPESSSIVIETPVPGSASHDTPDSVPHDNREVVALTRGVTFRRTQLQNLVLAEAPAGFRSESTGSGPIPAGDMYGPQVAAYQATYNTGNTTSDNYIYSSVQLYSNAAEAKTDLTAIQQQTMNSTSRVTSEETPSPLLPPGGFAYSQGPETEGGAGGPLAAEVWREGNAVFRVEVGMNDPMAKDIWEAFARSQLNKMAEDMIGRSVA